MIAHTPTQNPTLNLALEATPMKSYLLLLLVSLTPLSQAHDGHGLAGSHWHSTDALGFVAVLVVLAAVWWAKRK
ncbi:MAG: hypothetical protein EBT49_03830 [Betaproteobacteria bacterium]|nr:hypothetical protein [Betaproteobacteria bacterium]